MFDFLSRFFLKNTNALPVTRSDGEIQPRLSLVSTNREFMNDLQIEQTVADVLTIIKTNWLRLLLKHIKTVVIKYEQASYQDAYGNIELDKAKLELDYFIEKTIKKSLLSTLPPPHIPTELYQSILRRNLGDSDFSDDIHETIRSFLDIKDEEGFEDIQGTIAIDQMVNISPGRASNQALQFLLGDDYEQISNVAGAVRENKFDDAELSRLAQIVMMSTLISKEDLTILRKWFCQRLVLKASLDQILTGEEFESFCQKRLIELGWTVKPTKVTGDFGADLVIERSGQTTIIQCKYYSQPVGVKAVQEVFSAMTFYNADKAAVVSNNTYTKAAQQMAFKNKVALLHVDQLESLI